MFLQDFAVVRVWMTKYFKVIFWNVTKLNYKVRGYILLYEFTKDYLLLSGRCRALGRAISAQVYENVLLCKGI